MSLLENVTLHMELDSSDFKREFKDATTVVNKQMDALTLGASAFSAKWEDITSNLRSFKRVASGLAISAGIYAVTGAIAGASEAILTFRNNLEASEISMSYFAKDALQAKEYIRELEDFAAVTPFSTESAISMAQYLQAMSVPINSSKSMLKVISDTAAATGATEENMQRIVTALGQILTKGKLAAEEVRQLANANIPIYNILKEQLKLTGQEIKNLGNLNINASKAVVAILDGLKERYEGAADRIADTLGGMTETIKDDALIISESFFHGTLDRLEDRITGIRDKLDDWRDVALHYGTGGMIQAIIGDLDPGGSKHLEDFVISAVAGFKNLGDTIHEFVTKNGTALTVFTKTAYTGIMSLTIAADYLLRVFNKVQDVGEALVEKINKLTGMSLTLSDVVAGLLVFRTVGKTIYFAGNTALWAGKQFLNLGSAIANMLPVMAGASAFTKGLVSGLLTIGAAATTAYFGLKAIQGATGVTEGSSLISEDYEKQMAEYNAALSKYEDSLNEDYSSIADNWAAEMSGALDETEKKAKKTAKKIEKTWLMSFDEVFQIREDPVSKAVDDSLELFEDIDWGSFFKLPEFRFPEELDKALSQPAYSLADAIDTAQDQVGILNTLLPAIISGVGLVGTILKNRRDAIDKARKEGVDDESLMSERERNARFEKTVESVENIDKTTQSAAEQLNRDITARDNARAEVVKTQGKINELVNEISDIRLDVQRGRIGAEKILSEKLSELEIAKDNLRLQMAHLDELKSSASNTARVSAGVDAVADTFDKAVKQGIGLGRDVDISTPGRDLGINALANSKISEINDTAYKVYLELANGYERQYSIFEKLYDVEMFDKSLLQSELITIKGTNDALLETLVSYVNSGAKGVTKASAKGATINSKTLAAILQDIGHMELRKAVSLQAQLANRTAKQVVVDLGDILDSNLKSIKRNVETIMDAGSRLGTVVLSSEELALFNNIYDSITPLVKPVNDAVKELKQVNLAQKVVQNTGIHEQTTNALEIAENNFKEALKPLKGPLDTIQKLNDTSVKILNGISDIKNINASVISLPYKVYDSEHVNKLVSIANELRDYLTSGHVTFSTESHTGPKIMQILDEIEESINRLPDRSVTKQLSLDFIDVLNNAAGKTSHTEGTVQLTEALNKYSLDVYDAANRVANTYLDSATKIRNDLAGMGKVSVAQLDGIDKSLDSIKNGVKKIATISPKTDLYAITIENTKRVEDLANYLLENSKTNTAQDKLYTELRNALNEGKTNQQLQDIITSYAKDAKTRGLFSPNNRLDTRNNLANAFKEAKLELVMPEDRILPKLADVDVDLREIKSVLLERIHTEAVDADYAAIVDDVRKQLGIVSFKEVADANVIQEDIKKLFEGISKDINMSADELYSRIGNAIVPFENKLPSITNEMLQLAQNAGSAGKALEVFDAYTQTLANYNNIIDTGISAIIDKNTRLVDSALELLEGKADTTEYRWVLGNASVEPKDYRKFLTTESYLDSSIYQDILQGKGIGDTKKAQDAYAWLINTYDKRGQWNPYKSTGGFTPGILSSDNVFGRYIGLDSILSRQSDAASAISRIMFTDIGKSRAGYSLTSTLRGLLDNTIKEMSDEVVESFPAEFSMNASHIINRRVQSLIQARYGQAYFGDTIVDKFGLASSRLQSVIGSSDYGRLGVIQSNLISARDKTLFESIKALKDPVISATEAIKMFGTTAPDKLTDILNTFIAGPKLQGVLLAVTDASRGKLYDKWLKDTFTHLGTRSRDMSLKEWANYVQKITAQHIQTNNFSDDVVSDYFASVVIKLKDEEKAILEKYWKPLIAKRAEEVEAVLTLAQAAKDSKIYLNMSQHTMSGMEVAPTARYAIKASDIEKISDIAKTLTDYNNRFGAVLGFTDEMADNFDSLYLNLAKYAANTGDAKFANSILEQIADGINDGNLKLDAIFTVGDKELQYTLQFGNLPDTIKDALIDANVASKNIYNDLFHNFVDQYNDTASQVKNALEMQELIKQLTDEAYTREGGAAASFAGTNAAMRDTTFTAARTAEKIETYLGLDHTVSSNLFSLGKGRTFDAYYAWQEGTDPFMYENSSRLITRLVEDIENKTGKAITEILSPEDYSNIAGFLGTSPVATNAAAGTADAVIIPQVEAAEAATEAANATKDVADRVDEYLKNLARNRAAQSADAAQAAKNATQNAVPPPSTTAGNAGQYLPTDKYYYTLDEFFNSVKYEGRFSDEYIDLIKEAIGYNSGELYTEMFSRKQWDDLITEIINSNYTDAGSFKWGARKSTGYMGGSATFEDDLLNAWFKEGRYSNKAWFSAVTDTETAKALSNALNDSQRQLYGEYVRKMWGEYATDEAFRAGTGIGDGSLNASEYVSKKAAKEIFGDEFDEVDKILREYMDASGGGSGIFTGVGSLSDAFGNRFVQGILNPNELGISGLDWAFALKHGIDALTSGIDEFNEASARWSQMTGYNITPLDASGNIASGNITNIAQAAMPAVESLLLEGALTSIVAGAASTAITGALGITGLAAAGAGMVATLPVALLVSAFMAATGAFNQANISSETWKQMLNNTSWVEEQVKAQGASEAQAHKAQLDVARDIYLKYYENMSGLWSGFDKTAIAELDKYSDSNFTGEKSPIAYRYAIEEMLGRAHYGGVYEDQYGWLQDEIDRGNFGITKALNSDKIEQQLYTLFTTGGWDKINKLANGEKAGKMSDLESNWYYRLEYINDYTKAQINDYFVLYTDAVKYISEHTNSEIVSLLSSYNLPSSTMQEMVDGIVTIYQAGLEKFNAEMASKAAVMLQGSAVNVDLSTFATGSGTANRLLEGDLTGVDQSYLDALYDATGVYVAAVSDSMYALSYDIETVRDKMTGFTVSFPDTVKVGSETIEVKSIASDTKAVEILQGMGIHINADGGVTVSTVAVNANESGHSRNITFDTADISEYERSYLAARGLSLAQGENGNVAVSLDETAMQNALKGITYNLSGINLQSVSEAAIKALKAQGIILSQNMETGESTATITDLGFITGATDIAALLSNLDPTLLSQMNANVQAALLGIDAINAFGASHGESRMGSAAGIEINTGLLSTEYSAALEKALADAGITLQKTVDAEGNEIVYAAINNVGEQWNKAITQWKSSDISDEMTGFLEALGAEVYKSGEYTFVSTEKIIEKLADSSSSGLRQILFDNAELWDQFPEEAKQAFIAAGIATEDGFIKLEGEAIDGWTRYELNGTIYLSKAFAAIEQSMKDKYLAMQGTTVLGWDQLTTEQKVALEKLGITTREQYEANSDELLTLLTEGTSLVKNNTLAAWESLSEEQKAALAAMGITTSEEYAANYRALYTIGNSGFGLLREDTILGWDALDTTTKTKLAAMGITTEEQYKQYLADMKVETGQGLKGVDTETASRLLDLGVTTTNGWENIRLITDSKLSATEAAALGYMKFKDLPKTIQDALLKEHGGAASDLENALVSFNDIASAQEAVFNSTVDGMAADLYRVKDYAQQLRTALADPALQAETFIANLNSGAAAALEAAKSSSNKYASQTGSGSFGKGEKGAGDWKNWSNKSFITSQTVAISDRVDDLGNPVVYYIYNMDIDGTPGQVIKSSTGGWQKYYGSQPYSADRVPAFKLGGMVTGDGIFRAGEFGLNEAIIPLEQPQAMRRIGQALAAALPTWELVAPLQRMIGARDAGVASFSSFRSDKAESSAEEIITRVLDAQAHRAPTTSISSDDRRPLYVGTLIADKAGLRELDRQMKRVTRQDGGM